MNKNKIEINTYDVVHDTSKKEERNPIMDELGTPLFAYCEDGGISCEDERAYCSSKVIRYGE